VSVPVPQSDATLALDYLFDRLESETADRLDPVPAVVFGWREAPKQVNQGTGRANRIVLSPGDPGGKVGDLEGGKLPGRNPNSLATMVELATLYLWAYDATAATDARKQWRACRRLHDVVLPICIRAFRGRWKQLSKSWIRSELERPFGAEMQVVFAVESMVPDDLVPYAAGGVVTGIDLSINGQDC